MKMMDCVELIVDKREYLQSGVHKGMQGWICDEEKIDNHWLVDFPQTGENHKVSNYTTNRINYTGYIYFYPCI